MNRLPYVLKIHHKFFVGNIFRMYSTSTYSALPVGLVELITSNV